MDNFCDERITIVRERGLVFNGGNINDRSLNNVESVVPIIGKLIHVAVLVLRLIRTVRLIGAGLSLL